MKPTRWIGPAGTSARKGAISASPRNVCVSSGPFIGWKDGGNIALNGGGCIGSGLGMPPVERTAPADFCPTEARLLAAAAAAAESAAEPARGGRATLVLLRRPANPAG